MKPKVIFQFALVLGSLAVSATIARAQPGGGFTFSSLETKILDARLVFRGTITKVSDAVVHTNNQANRQGIYANIPLESYDIHNYTFGLRVDEVLKGSQPREPLEFTVSGVGKWDVLEQSADGRVSYLWFVNDSEKSIGTNFFAGINFIFLGPMPPGESNGVAFNNFQRLYDMDMTVLTRPEDILARARSFAKQRSKTTAFHSFRLPELSSGDHFFVNSQLVVPVEPTLEKTATHLIDAPEDFISATNSPALLSQWRCDLRAEGASALRHFKSAKNIGLLKSLLDAPDFWMIRDGSAENAGLNASNRIYSVRINAYEVLKGWGVAASKPVTNETIGEARQYYEDWLGNCGPNEIRCLWFLNDTPNVGMEMTLKLTDYTVTTVRDVYNWAQQGADTRKLSHYQVLSLKEIITNLPASDPNAGFNRSVFVSVRDEGAVKVFRYDRHQAPAAIQRIYDLGGGHFYGGKD